MIEVNEGDSMVESEAVLCETLNRSVPLHHSLLVVVILLLLLSVWFTLCVKSKSYLACMDDCSRKN